MDIKEFTTSFATQFENIEAESIKEETQFRELQGWDSLTALFIMEMIDEKYNTKVSGDDMRKAQTIQDLFDIVVSKK